MARGRIQYLAQQLLVLIQYLETITISEHTALNEIIIFDLSL
jgi:hypothetical protein